MNKSFRVNKVYGECACNSNVTGTHKCSPLKSCGNCSCSDESNSEDNYEEHHKLEGC